MESRAAWAGWAVLMGPWENADMVCLPLLGCTFVLLIYRAPRRHSGDCGMPYLRGFCTPDVSAT